MAKISDDYQHGTAGPGMFDECSIGNHQRLDPLARQPFHEFPWSEVFSHLDGEPPDPPRKYEALAAALREILLWMVTPKRLRQVGFRALELARAWGHADLLTSKQKKALRSRRWAARKKARKTP